MPNPNEPRRTAREPRRPTPNEPQRHGLDRKTDPREPKPRLSEGRSRMVGNNLGLAFTLSQSFRESHPEHSQDFEGTALLALCEAAARWVKSKGPFGAYARVGILGALKNELARLRRKGITGEGDGPEVVRMADDAAGGTVEPRIPAVLCDDEPDRAEQLIGRLPEREGAIVRAYYFEGLDDTQAGAAAGVSRSWGYRLRTAAVRKLRAQTA